MDVKQIVFLKLSELLVQCISAVKEQLVVIVIIRQLNQVQSQQLLEPLSKPHITYIVLAPFGLPTIVLLLPLLRLILCLVIDTLNLD